MKISNEIEKMKRFIMKNSEKIEKENNFDK